MVVTSKFRRPPDQPCSYFTVANVHMHIECVKLLVLRHCGAPAESPTAAFGPKERVLSCSQNRKASG